MVEFIDIPNEDGDITDFDFKVNGKVYHAGIDQLYEFGSEGVAPGAGCAYDNAADYESNLSGYVSRANPDFFEIEDEDWDAIVDHFANLIHTNEDKYMDTWEGFGEENYDDYEYSDPTEDDSNALDVHPVYESEKSEKAPLTEAVKKTSLNALVAEILKSDPPKPIKRPGDAVKWFKDLAKDKEFVKEQTNKFIDGKKLDKAIDFLENINYLLTIGESEATKLVKKYAKDEKKFPLIKA